MMDLNLLMEDQKYSRLSAALKFTCLKGNLATFVCSSRKCLHNPFICTQSGCTCTKDRHECCEIRRLQGITKTFLKEGPANIAVNNSYNCLIRAYDQIIAQLIGDKQKWILRKEHHRFGPASLQFIKFAEGNKIQSIKSELIDRVVKELEDENDNEIELDMMLIKKEMKKIEERSKSLREELNMLLYNTTLLLPHKNKLKQFFPKPVSKFTLLFTASENGFSADAFHHKCDHVPHTVVIIKSSYGKIFGGYNALKWNQDAKGYASDPSRSCFLFSLSENRKFFPIQPQKSIYNQKGYGPTFGRGYDIYISDKCDQNTSSYCDFPCSYGNWDIKNSQGSYTLMMGCPDDYKFKVKEYEVYQVHF